MSSVWILLATLLTLSAPAGTADSGILCRSSASASPDEDAEREEPDLSCFAMAPQAEPPHRTASSALLDP